MSEFGPLALEAVMKEMVRLGLARTNINRHLVRLKSPFIPSPAPPAGPRRRCCCKAPPAPSPSSSSPVSCRKRKPSRWDGAVDDRSRSAATRTSSPTRNQLTLAKPEKQTANEIRIPEYLRGDRTRWRSANWKAQIVARSSP